MRTLVTLPLASLAIAAMLAPALALAGSGKKAFRGDDELQSLHRQLRAARIVHKLELSTDQRRALIAISKEARSVRGDLDNDPALASAKAAMKKTLARALREIRKSGEPAPQTRVEIETLKGQMRSAHKSRKADMKELMRSVRDTLNEDQLESLQEMRQHARRRGGERGGRHGGKMLLRLITSDEFAAELSR